MQVNGAIEIRELKAMVINYHGYQLQDKTIDKLVLSQSEARDLWQQLGHKLRLLAKEEGK